MLPSITVADVFKWLLPMPSYLVIPTIPEARQIWNYVHLDRKTLSQAARVTVIPQSSGDCSDIQGSKCRSLFLGCELPGLAYHFSFFLPG